MQKPVTCCQALSKDMRLISTLLLFHLMASELSPVRMTVQFECGIHCRVRRSLALFADICTMLRQLPFPLMANGWFLVRVTKRCGYGAQKCARCRSIPLATQM